MDLFLRDIQFEILKKYVCYYKLLESERTIYKDSKCIKITYTCKQEEISITLWNSQITEFEVYVNEDLKYYLHFQLINFLQAKDLLDDAFKYCEQFQEVKETNVLICCSGGLTSTFFANQFMEYIGLNQANIVVSANSYTAIESAQEKYDLIMLAPQIAYLLPSIKKNINKPIVAIAPSIFATNNFVEAFNQIKQNIEGDNKNEIKNLISV